VAATEDRARQAQAEIQRLAGEVHKLRADRERLNTRIGSLERVIDITGSILRRTVEKQAAAAQAPPQPSPPIIAALSMPPLQSALAPWPAVASAPPEPSVPATKPAEATAPKPVEAAAPKSDVAPAKIAEAAQEKPTIDTAPKHRATAEVRMPPQRVAALPVRRATPAPVKPAFAIDLGGALTTETLRSHYADEGEFRAASEQSVSNGRPRPPPRPPALSAAGRAAADLRDNDAVLRGARNSTRRLPADAICRRPGGAALTFGIGCQA